MRAPHVTELAGVDAVVYGIPFDTATSYRTGARFGPEAIRSASSLLRPYNPALAVNVVDALSIVDYGDLPVSPGDTERTYAQVEEALAPIVEAGAFAVALGGDHSITLAELRALARKHGPMALVQLDSHGDVWEQYFGQQYFHGTTFKRAVEEGLLDAAASVQAGMRGSLYGAQDIKDALDLGFTVLSTDELRTVVAEASALVPQRHRQMLLSILDLERVSVDDIMIPRQEISAIDIAQNWEDIIDRLRQTPHSRLPVYDGTLSNLIGILQMKRVAQELARGTLSRQRLMELAAAREPYFVPEGTPLNQQLAQFQRTRRRLAFVVNEYGDIAGLVTLEDILEEIVGEFTTDPTAVTHKDVSRDAAGNWLVNGSATIRALNRTLGWQLPALGPRTLNGLLLEKLETIPTPGTALRIGDYDFEILQIADNAIRTVRVRQAPAPQSASA